MKDIGCYMGWNRGDGILHIYITFSRVTECV